MMEKLRYFAVSLIFICIFLIAGGCRPEAEPQKIQIGVSFDTFVLERWVRDRETFVSTIGTGKGAELDVQSAGGDTEEQIRQIQTFIKNKVDVIVIIPVDCEAVSEVINKALGEGIKIISYDRMVLNAPVDLYISFDNEEVGRLMADAMIENLPRNGKIMMICGPRLDNNSLLVEKGFDERIAGSQIQVVRRSYVKDWTPEYGFEAMASFSETDISEVDGIMCGNDGLAGYAIRALAERRVAGQVFVTGQDADLEACQRIVEGTQSMTVFKNFDELAERAGEYALMLGQGTELRDVDDVIENGEYKVPYKALTPVAVTAENMQEVITDSGFHIYEQVYLNVKHE